MTSRRRYPTEAQARKLAIATGFPVATATKYILPMSQEEERRLSEEQSLVRGLYNSIREIAAAPISPEQMAQLGPQYDCLDLAEATEKAAVWLAKLAGIIQGH